MLKKLRLVLVLIAGAFIVGSSGSFAASSNLIANPSVETVNPANSSLPLDWVQRKWGVNDGQFTYQNTGHTGSRSLAVQITSYTSGDVKWGFNPVSVTPGALYTYSEYYESNVTTDVGAFYTDSSGNSTYKYLGSVSANPTAWKQYSINFTVPTGAQNVSVVNLLAKVGSLQTDDFSLKQISIPQVNITSPTPNSSVSGVVNLSANASDTFGISSVQFQLDSFNIGSPITTGPYQYFWDSTSVANGIHTLTAVATNVDGQTTMSAPVSINVNNVNSDPNLIPNGSFETPNPSNPSQPLDWKGSGSGVSTSIFNYLTTSGHTGTHSVEVQITNYTSGSMHWRANSVPIVGNQLYDYSEYYESNAKTAIDAAITMSDGSVQYMYLASPSPSPSDWTKIHQQFYTPAGAVSISMFHELQSVGWLTTDDYSLQAFNYQGFTRPIISVTDDDSFASFYNNGLPILQKYGLLSTDYIITGKLNTSNYMSPAMVQGLNKAGEEIGSHTVTHPDLTTLTSSQLTTELSSSQTYLQNLIGIPVIDFAAPFGTYNQQVLDAADQYYQSYRTVQAGYNAKNNFDPNNILVQNMHSDTTLAQVQAWIAQAQATNTWLVLVYHQVDPSTSAGLYNTYPADFDAQMSAIKSSGIPVETVSQALQEIKPQL